MAKEKIFKPEDFDKNPKSNKKKPWWIVGSCLVVICVIAGVVGGKMYENKTPTPIDSQPKVAQVTKVEDSALQIDSLSPNPIDLVGETDEVKKEVIPAQPKLESNPISNSEIESEALKVIRGDYGNVPERRAKLGSRFQSIQNRVNKLKREGFF